MADFEKALQKLHPDGSKGIIGRHHVFRYSTVTPAHTFESVILDVGNGRLVALTARDSFDLRLAEFLLDQIDRLELPSLRARTIRVVYTAFPKPWTFDTIIVVPPIVARRFEYESRLLQQVTYWVVPAFDGEFADRGKKKAFWHQIHRKDGYHSSVVLWNRSRTTRPKFND